MRLTPKCFAVCFHSYRYGTPIAEMSSSLWALRPPPGPRARHENRGELGQRARRPYGLPTVNYSHFCPNFTYITHIASGASAWESLQFSHPARPKGDPPQRSIKKTPGLYSAFSQRPGVLATRPLR